MKPLRSPTFGTQEVNGLKSAWRNIDQRVYTAVLERLQSRSDGEYQSSDDDIFEPYIDSYALAHLSGYRFHSAFRDLGYHLLRRVFEYEVEKCTKVNKEQIYFAMAVNALECGDEINTLAYWELALRQHRRTKPNRGKGRSLIKKLETHFPAVLAGIEESHVDISLLKRLRKRYPEVCPTFTVTLRRLTGVHQSEFLAAGLRNRKVLRWLRQVKRFHMLTVFAQELINALCVLTESCLKEKLCPQKHITFGPLLSEHVQKQFRRFLTS